MVIYKSPYPAAPLPNEPFHDTIFKAIKKHADSGKNKTAFISGDNKSATISYQELYDYAHSIATFLHHKGFGKDVACVVLPNCWQYGAFFLATSRVGGAISGASALFTDYELQRQFIDSKAKVVLTTEDFMAKTLIAAKNSPTVKFVIVIPKSPNTVLPDGVFNFNDVLKTPIDPKLPKPKINIHKDLILLPYSSGTTGAPKGVMISHANWATMLSIYSQHDRLNNSKVLDANWDYEKEKILLFLPFYHVFGFGLLVTSLLFGSAGVILSHFEPNNFCGAVQDNKIRMLPLVPPILVFLAKHPICNNFDLSSVQYILCGAAPAGKDICEEIYKRYPNIKFIQQGYGMTELTMATHFPDLAGGQPLGSVGRLASNLEMKIVDISSQKELKQGEKGEICVRGPTIMMGYLGREEATKGCIINGWMHTGDIGFVDKDGNLFIVDRLKELIKVKGLQVAPAELEDLLLSHPRIRDAAVIGVPDKRAGELPRAYVVRADDKLTEEEVKDFVKSKVSAYKQLAGGVEFLQEIPKSAAGKILRRMLRDKATSKL